MNPRMLIVALCAALALAACGDDGDSSSTADGSTASAADAAERPEPKVEVPKGAPPKDLEVKDLIKGSGPAGGQVIPGWDRGIDGMRVGGQRELIIPPEQAYGRIGQPPAIGPDATLVFVIDLLGIQ